LPLSGNDLTSGKYAEKLDSGFRRNDGDISGSVRRNDDDFFGSLRRIDGGYSDAAGITVVIPAPPK